MSWLQMVTPNEKLTRSLQMMHSLGSMRAIPAKALSRVASRSGVSLPNCQGVVCFNCDLPMSQAKARHG